MLNLIPGLLGVLGVLGVDGLELIESELLVLNSGICGGVDFERFEDMLADFT